MGVELELELDLLAGLYCNNTVKKGWKSNDTRRNFVHRPTVGRGKAGTQHGTRRGCYRCLLLARGSCCN